MLGENAGSSLIPDKALAAMRPAPSCWNIPVATAKRPFTTQFRHPEICT
jgi:hypothetical protein